MAQAKRKSTTRKKSPARKSAEEKRPASVTSKPASPKGAVKPTRKGAAAAKTKASAKTKKAPSKIETQAKSKPGARKGAAKKSATAAKTVKSVDAKKPAISISPSKILPREFLFALAEALRTAVQPHILAVKGREVVGSATSGDATFQLDRIAEKALLIFLREAKLPVAYYSEDSGYTTFTSGQPQHLLIVDPIDGTRAAKCGFEACVVAVASTRVIERPRLSDIDSGCVLELMGPRTFYAERGKGTRIYENGSSKKPKLSSNADLEMVSWSMTVPARPAELIFPTAARLIDLTSLKGGFFACNSTSYSLTRLLTRQLDACVDFANRFLRDIPKIVEDQFINAGRGAVLGIAPYDIAASLLIAQEAGCVVTDAYGKSFDDVLALDSSLTNHQSMIAAANKELHGMLMSFFDTRIKQFESLLKRRASQREE